MTDVDIDARRNVDPGALARFSAGALHDADGIHPNAGPKAAG